MARGAFIWYEPAPERPPAVNRDEEFTEYVPGRLASWRRGAYLLCQDWRHADDLVQAAITKLYTHWGRARAVEHTDAYMRRAVVREFLRDGRSGRARRVTLGAQPPEPATSRPVTVMPIVTARTRRIGG